MTARSNSVCVMTYPEAPERFRKVACGGPVAMTDIRCADDSSMPTLHLPLCLQHRFTIDVRAQSMVGKGSSYDAEV